MLGKVLTNIRTLQDNQNILKDRIKKINKEVRLISKHLDKHKNRRKIPNSFKSIVSEFLYSEGEFNAIELKELEEIG